MRWIAAILPLVAVAACQSVNKTYPLSVPLPNGTTGLNCQAPSVVAGQGCTRNCCTDEKMFSMAGRYLCGFEWHASDVVMATIQHDLYVQRDFCSFRGFAVVAPQLWLTANATATLNDYNAEDEKFRRSQTIFFSLQMLGGHLGLPLLLVVSIFCLRKTRRDLTFLNFCFTWIFSSVVFSVGLYRRGPSSHLSGPLLPFIYSDQMCLAQAGLITGAQVMTDTAMCALIIQLWLDFRAATHGPRGLKETRRTKAALLAAPYVCLLAFSLPALQPGARAYQLNFYCLFTVYTGLPFFVATYSVMIVILVVTLVFDACIIRILYRHWRFFRHSDSRGLQVSLPLVLRVIFFCVYRVVVTIANAATIINVFVFFDSLNVIPVWVDMLQAATPLVAFLVFGTSKEFLDALLFWRKTPAPPKTNSKALSKSDVSSDSVLDITHHEQMIHGDAAL